MASDKKKSSTPPSENGGSVPSTKRPARTIELEAEDVTIANSPSKKTSEDSETNNAGKKSESKSESDPKDKAKPDDAPPNTQPSQRTQPADIKSFVTHLAAGLAGGLIGVIGAGIVLDRLPVSSAPATGTSVAANENAKLAKRLDAIEFRLDALPKGNRTAEIGEAVGKLETKLAALEIKPPEDMPEIKDMVARLGKLEGTLKTLREAGTQEGASGVAQSAALTGRIEEVSAGLETRMSTLKDDIAALSRAFDARVSNLIQDSGKTASELAERIGSFEEMTSLLENKIAETALPMATLKSSSGAGAALALAFENLRRAIERGRPYSEQLKTLKALAPDALDLTAFDADAATGVATKAELLAALPGVLKAARAATLTSGNGTFLERVVTNARSVVRVRRIGPSEGNTPAQVLSRMEAQLKAQNLTGVLSEAPGLKGTALVAMQTWLDRAIASRKSETRLDGLGQNLLSGLQTKTDEKR